MSSVILRKNMRWKNYGHHPTIDPDWDDLFAPVPVAATQLEQYEGTGRNNFGCEIAPVRKPAGQPVSTVSYRPAPVMPKPRPVPFAYGMTRPRAFVVCEPQPGPKPRPLKPRPWELMPDMQSLRPFCFTCGWRKGGPDSWNGFACKCGVTEPPIVSKSGQEFFV